MSSFPRRLQRKIQRAHPDYEPKPQVTVVRPDGYKTLRVTRGWIFISNRRLEAQRRMAHMLNHVIMPRRKKAPKIWRKPAPVPPSTETRQQRRRRATGRS